MPRTKKSAVEPTETIDQQPEVETISINDACQQLKTSEQVFRLALQDIRPDDFDSVKAISVSEFEGLRDRLNTKALPQTEQPQPEPKTEQPEQLPAPLAQQQQPAPPAPVNDLATALQFALTQQTSLSYSDGLKVEAAAAEGAATAYREFLSHQQGYSSTAQSLHQLQQALDITRYQKASGELSEAQQAFLSGLQANSQNLQNQQQSNQNLVNNIKTQSRQQMDQLNNAVLGAIQDLNQAKDGSDLSLL